MFAEAWNMPSFGPPFFPLRGFLFTLGRRKEFQKVKHGTNVQPQPQNEFYFPERHILNITMYVYLAFSAPGQCKAA